MTTARTTTDRRVSRHVWLGVCSAALVTLLFVVQDGVDWHHMLSMATAYAGLLGVGATLALGPINLLRRRPNPVSTNLRRDVGIWAGIVSIAHVIIGVQVHLRPRFWLYFVYPPEQQHQIPLRHDAFGITNYSGLAATLILAMLLTISNDVSLRRLGTARWKSLQRWNYASAALIVAHGFMFQWLEGRQPSWVIVLGAMTMVMLLLQWVGVRAVRRSRGSLGA